MNFSLVPSVNPGKALLLSKIENAKKRGNFVSSSVRIN